jgi:hypothetical protein
MALKRAASTLGGPGFLCPSSACDSVAAHLAHLDSAMAPLAEPSN